MHQGFAPQLRVIEIMGDSIENYRIFNLVGRGGFAQVYRATCRDTGEEVAIKMIDKDTIVQKRMESRVQKEVSHT